MKRYSHGELLRKFIDLPTVADWADHLADVGYEPRLKWNLCQICRHLAMTLEMSRRGFPDMQVPFAAKVLRPFLRLGILTAGRMASGVPAPPILDPGEVGHDSDGIRVLKREISAFQQIPDGKPMPDSPLLGRLSKKQWERLHLVHAAHHFRWLSEKQGG